MKHLYLKEYLKQVVLATGLGLVATPFIALTNFTASLETILIHALFFWIFLPPAICLAELWRRNKKLSTAVSIYLLTITIVSIFSVYLFHFITSIPYNLLLSPSLWGALYPIYTGYLFLLFAKVWREQRSKQIKLELERNKAAYQALSKQLRPHFLFNSLNMIEFLIEEHPEKATSSLRQLASLYRFILVFSEEDLVCLEEEIKLTENYLKLQKNRFEEKLQVKWSVNQSLHDQLIPPLLLLNSVENACKFGVENQAETRPIEIRIDTDKKSEWSIRVCNGVKEGAGNMKGEGKGHRDARNRIQLAFGGRASLDVKKGEGQFIYTLTFPKESP